MNAPPMNEQGSSADVNLPVVRPAAPGFNAADAAAAAAAIASAEGDAPDPTSAYLPISPSQLVFRDNQGLATRLPPRVEYISLEELEDGKNIKCTWKVFVGVVLRYKKAKVDGDGRTLFSRLNNEKKENQNFDRYGFHIKSHCLVNSPSPR